MSVSSNHWIVNHYKNLHFINNWCGPSAVNTVPLRCITYSSFGPCSVSSENKVRDSGYFRNAQPPFVFSFDTRSTGAVPTLSEIFFFLGRMKTSLSFVARAFLHSLNRPREFCSACGVASVLAGLSPPLCRLVCTEVYWSWAKVLHISWQDRTPFHKEVIYIIENIGCSRSLEVNLASLKVEMFQRSARWTCFFLFFLTLGQRVFVEVLDESSNQPLCSLTHAVKL